MRGLSKMFENETTEQKEKTDKLSISLRFNGKAVRLEETGNDALSTYQKIMSIFSMTEN